MNILFINHYAGSRIHGMEYRPYYMAREWCRAGHYVAMCAASYSHLRTVDVSAKRIRAELIDGVNYLWLPTPYYEGNGIRRAFNMLWFTFQLVRAQAQLTKAVRPDIIIASSPHPLVVFPAYRMARRIGAPMVFEVRDLWPLTLIELGSLPQYHPFVALLQAAEDFGYRHCDLAISLLPDAHSHMVSHGLTPEKFNWIATGTSVEDWQQQSQPLPEEHARLLNDLRANNYFVVGYAGAHGVANSLENLVKTAELLRPVNEIVFLLVGKGPEKKTLMHMAQSLRLKNMLFLPPVPKPALPTLFQGMDALYIGWQKSRLYRFGISPNKLFEYLMSGRPIIHAVDASNDLVAETNSGFSVPPEDPAAAAQAILKLKAMSPEARNCLGGNGVAYVASHYDYTILARQMDSLMVSLLAGRDGSGDRSDVRGEK